MKIRNGFVSNSSSSSFIVGIARVTDLDKLNAYVASKGLAFDKFDFKVTTLREIKECNRYGVIISGDKVVVESFRDSSSISMKGMADSDLLLFCNISNDEGDEAFWDYGEDTVDYNIDLDWFDNVQQEMYDIFLASDAGIDTKTAQVSYGAARNG